MRSLLSLGLLPVAAAMLATISTTANQCQDTPSSSLLVGASVVTILPEVDGSTAYFDPLRLAPLATEPGDPGTDPGVFIQEWDVGTLAIGNGARTSHWAHDEIRAGAVAFKDLNRTDGKTLVLVTVDVYMMFRQDIQVILDKLRLTLGEDRASKLEVIVHAIHNHMAPDTSGMNGINEDYYDYLTSQIALAIRQATEDDALQPASLKVATSRYQFGMADSHAPHIADSTLNTLQAISTDEPGRVLATVVQWANHPEDTCFYGEDVFATPEQAEYLKSIDECMSDDGVNCNIEGQFISGGFAGEAVRRLMDSTAAPALYFNGPIGGLLAPLHAYVWETEGENGKPAGDGLTIPEGATLLSQSFRSQAVNGLELFKRVEQDLSAGEEILEPPVTFTKYPFYTRLSNMAFRVGLSVTVTGNPYLLGYKKRELFICPDGQPWNDTTCVSDNYESESDPVLRVPVRLGNAGRTEVNLVNIGPISIITMPGEAESELVEGLPADFREDPRQVYYTSTKERTDHTDATRYHIPSYARQMLPGQYKWAIALAMDELGYMVPQSDFRIKCVADEELIGGVAGNCLALYQAGIMDYQSYDGDNWSISGARCKAITDNPALLEAAPYINHAEGAMWAAYTCRYGQLLGEADGHYEETLAASWDYVDDVMAAVAAVTGYTGPLDEVNPDFIGYNLAH